MTKKKSEKQEEKQEKTQQAKGIEEATEQELKAAAYDIFLQQQQLQQRLQALNQELQNRQQ